MHPEETRRRVDGPIGELMDYILSSDAFADPTKEKIDEDDEHEPGSESGSEGVGRGPIAPDGAEQPADADSSEPSLASD